MSKPTSWFRRPRVLWITLSTAATLAVAVAVLASASSPSATPWSPPTATDSAAMQSVIEASWAAFAQVLPETDALAGRVPQDVAARAKEKYLAVMQAVGTQEYASSEAVTSVNFARSFQGDLDIGLVVKKLETKVLGLDYKGTLPNGDVVMWAKLWDGEVDLQFASGKVGLGPAVPRYVDDTPTWQYVMRKVDGQWKIASEAQVFISEDTSPEYGPDTPHWVDTKPLVAVPSDASQPTSSPTAFTASPSAKATAD